MCWWRNIVTICRCTVRLRCHTREDIDLSRSTLADIVGQVAGLVRPLIDALARYVMAGERVHGDDSVLQTRAVLSSLAVTTRAVLSKLAVTMRAPSRLNVACSTGRSCARQSRSWFRAIASCKACLLHKRPFASGFAVRQPCQCQKYAGHGVAVLQPATPLPLSLTPGR
jgi:hypothetical protein